MAWLVTEPELFAIGEAVAETPPTVSARRTLGHSKLIPIAVLSDTFFTV